MSLNRKTETGVEVDMVADTMRTAKGNAPQTTKDNVATWWVDNSQGQGFGRFICAGLAVKEMSIFDHPEIPGKKQGKMVFEIEVMKGEWLHYCVPLISD
jgi:acyl-coenzyme A thioesterase 13